MGFEGKDEADERRGRMTVNEEDERRSRMTGPPPPPRPEPNYWLLMPPFGSQDYLVEVKRDNLTCYVPRYQAPAAAAPAGFGFGSK